MRSIALRCSVASCGGRPTRLLGGMCEGHYKRVQKYGSAQEERPLQKNHGMVGTSEYHSWYSMKTRCYNVNDETYQTYGARGITVCDRWRYSFSDFYADMGPKPSPRHTIDRINRAGNYEPNNCRWATKVEQSINRRSPRNSHRYRGVRKNTCSRNSWYASVFRAGQEFCLYGLKTTEEAAWMYDQLALAIHGEDYAQLNFDYVPTEALKDSRPSV